ncbi:hypothetical protein EUGRSUZ_J01014 [Eucalyptus grandis]|uniref:Uncharacterized protein n=2 Tax=Eucalyptus grandis TaxID=71139 RepID=A0ACC3J4V8_EUCGR|nr:hypothetical protein EUGRSUZ_J01014 [Eucalyptus grandis]
MILSYKHYNNPKHHYWFTKTETIPIFHCGPSLMADSTSLIKLPDHSPFPIPHCSVAEKLAEIDSRFSRGSRFQYKREKKNIIYTVLLRSLIHRSVTRMKIRSAAMKEYLRAATRMATETKQSCHSTCTLAHVSRPVSPTARMLSGSRSSRSPSLRSNMGGRRRRSPFKSPSPSPSSPAAPSDLFSGRSTPSDS